MTNIKGTNETKQTKKKELHEQCVCKDCIAQREMSKAVLDSWVQLEAGRIAREIIYSKSAIVYDEAKEEDRNTIWKDIGKAWKTMNDSIKVGNPICVHCGKELTHNLRLYCACGYAFCSNQCSDKYHKGRKDDKKI